MRYLPSLDGLRTLAVFVVLAHHANQPDFGGGFIGVDLFFVLSGYLITRLLDETNPTLLQFYGRRLARLSPPLLLMLLAYLAVFPLLIPDYPHARDAGIAALYLSDYAKSIYNLPTYIAHTWSLSVEEHFYLLWPLIFFRFRPSTRTLSVAFVALTAWRIYRGDWASAYPAFDTHCTGLVLGCLIARFPRDRFPAWPGLVVLAGCVYFLRPETGFALGPGMTLAELAAAVVVLGRAPAWLEKPWLVYLGKLSYGIYLWHVPIIMICRHYGMMWGWPLPIALFGSIALSALSYHTLEAWVRSKRRRAVAPAIA